MKANSEFDIVVYGATGFTGRLVAEHLFKRYGLGSDFTWAMAGRSADKLAQVRDEMGMVRRARTVVTTVGPYTLYGSELVAACASNGTDYLDLTGETLWSQRKACFTGGILSE